MALQASHRHVRRRPATVAAGLTVVGYVAIVATFALDPGIYPDLSLSQVNALTHLIAAINATTVVLIGLGWHWIRNGYVDRHRLAMVAAFVLILCFLVVYLLRVGGGGEKYIAGAPDPVRYAYLGMLAIHVVLSMVAVPVVLYALLLGLTRSPSELRRTRHATVGRVAAGAWLVSLLLGIVTYVMLNHVYTYEFVPSLAS